MLKESGLNDLINDEDKYQWLNPSIKAGKNSDSKAKEYFSQISKSEVVELYHKYRIDHELFDYSIEPYFSFASDKDEL